MNIPLILVTTSLVFLFVFSLAIFTLIVVRRILTHRREIRLKRLAGNIEKDLLGVLTNPSAPAIRKVAETYRSRPDVLMNALIHFLETFQEEDRRPLKVIYDLALRKRLAKRIRSPFSLTRLKAARPFILFSGPSDTEAILRLLRDRPAVRLAAINALSRIPNRTAVSQIFQAFNEDPSPNLRAYMNVFFGLGTKIEPYVKEYLRRALPPSKLTLLIEIAGAVPLPMLHLDLLGFVNHEDIEIRVSTARALGALGTPIPGVIAALDSLTQDAAWEVQAQAFKSLGRLGNLGSLDILTQGLFSPQWFCRRNAGFALAGLGTDGIQRLKRIAVQKKDEFASDMAQMVLEHLVHFQTGR